MFPSFPWVNTGFKPVIFTSGMSSVLSSFFCLRVVIQKRHAVCRHALPHKVTEDVEGGRFPSWKVPLPPMPWATLKREPRTNIRFAGLSRPPPSHLCHLCHFNREFTIFPPHYPSPCHDPRPTMTLLLSPSPMTCRAVVVDADSSLATGKQGIDGDLLVTSPSFFLGIVHGL